MRVLITAMAVVALLSLLDLHGSERAALAAEPKAPERSAFAIDRADLLLSPYVWKRSGSGETSRAEAAMPGAYLKVQFQGSGTVGLIVDGTANVGCPGPSMPVIEFSLDEKPFEVVPLVKSGEVYTLPLADGLEIAGRHRLEVYFRATDLTLDRWKSSATHLRLAGLALDKGATLLPHPRRPRTAIGFGDSITEGVGVAGLFTSWQLLGVNNARTAWLPLTCDALDCEYGQLGSGGLGMTRTLNMPPLPLIWDHYDENTARLTSGRLLPEPDYVFCALGTNDYEKDITTDYTQWLTALRRACPGSRVFCIVPPLGVHRDEIRTAVETRNRAGDRRVHLIDPARLSPAYRAGKGATRFAHDGVHPSEYGSAVLGAFVAIEVQKVLCGTDDSPR